MGVAVGVVVLLGIIAWDYMHPPEPAVIAQPAPELKGEATKVLECKPVVIYRDKVAKDLGVPEAPGQHVVDAVKIPGDDNPGTVTAVYDDRTGKVSQFVRMDPLPWLARANLVEVGAAYGVKTGHDGFVLRIDGQWDLLQVKALRFGLYGQADSDGTGMIGVRAHFRF